MVNILQRNEVSVVFFELNLEGIRLFSLRMQTWHLLFLAEFLLQLRHWTVPKVGIVVIEVVRVDMLSETEVVFAAWGRFKKRRELGLVVDWYLRQNQLHH